jgi:hypothetical protein
VAVTVKLVTGEPPVSPGGVHPTSISPDLIVRTRFFGAFGIVAGVEDAEIDPAPVPAALIARTTTVYDVPFTSPAMVQFVAVDEHVAPPGVAVATYPVTGVPPFDSGAVHDTAI